MLVSTAAAVALASLATWIGLHPATVPPAVRLEAVSDPGPAPFSTGVGHDHDDVVPPANVGGDQRGDTPGLYGQAGDACDPDALVTALQRDGRAAAWARAAGRSDDDAEATIKTLTPLVLRTDVLVTEHAWSSDPAASVYRAVLQAGSAVLVDDRGLPRARCASGNPLGPPAVALGTDLAGTPWRWFSPSAVTLVTDAEHPLTKIVALDLDSGTTVDVSTRH
ncbi:MAG: hypothetical protein H0X35_15660 [Pseudonocardiales bacterium]|nr:hypothetical protein [Pseudonocardiales bacterium]